MKQITGITNARVSNDGDEICFDIITKNGCSTYALPLADLGRLILFFTGAATAVAETNVDATDEASGNLFPIPVTSLKLQPATNAGTGILAVNISGFWLGFEAEAATFLQFLNTVEREILQPQTPPDRKLN